MTRAETKLGEHNSNFGKVLKNERYLTKAQNWECNVYLWIWGIVDLLGIKFSHLFIYYKYLLLHSTSFRDP